MKRYVYNCEWRDAEKIEADVVIVGGGAAGLYTALNLEPDIKCVILNKSGSEQCNSIYAQGGIATVIMPNHEDDPKRHFEDTVIAGAGLCDEKAVEILVNEAWINIKQLIADKVPFDRSGDEFRLTREGGHSRNRILHCGGDATGLHLTNRLYEIALEKKNISIYNGMFFNDVVTDESGGVAGALTFNQEGRPVYFVSPNVVIASGGIGRVYKNSTNAVCATGDGIAAAFRAGAKLKDMEFVQFHPTAFVRPNAEGRYFLISEALRGEGAVLRNELGVAFMQGVHPLADLAPRDIVARAINSEMKKRGIPNVFLDITSKSREELQARFPTIFSECLANGIDISKDWIPVIPVQHYFMGGIKTDVDACTNIPGLYACGESACTGVHGANRLASNSLLECMVFGRRCALHINHSKRPGHSVIEIEAENGALEADIDFEGYSGEIRTLMTENCGIVRNENGLERAYFRISEIFETLSGIAFKNTKQIELYNQAIVAINILAAAISRKNSVGAHFRDDEITMEGK